MDEIIDIVQPENLQRYAVYTVVNRLDDGRIFNRSFIVIKNDYGVIVRFTRLQDYAGIYQKKSYKPLQANPEMKLYFVCSMLNYILVDHGKAFGIRHVFDITKPMLQKYFDAYAVEQMPDGGFHSRETVERCIRVVTDFMASLEKNFRGYMKVDHSQLYVKRTIMTKSGKLITKDVPAFQATGIFEHDGLFRDIPTKAMEILLEMAFRYTPDIALGICMQAFAGLRAGEVCSVRQENSPLGPGIRFTEIGGQVREIQIDLRKEVALRSDSARVGMIKKERLQKVYPAFIGSFMAAYELHKKYLQTVTFEEEYRPMFINNYGLAMTYENYRNRFRNLVNNHLRPCLINHSDPELRIYGQMLYENQLGTHALRHWYTVQLVLRGEGIEGIQSWRGDSSPESAFQYLQNKGDLVHELEETNEKLLEILMLAGGDLSE